ncbi:hypothetical protein [Paenibacillus alvei]|uniref:Uncharacterized protein n=1 Tax=Paenibacillus alvei TaxID=44250 RepID=A0ABT4H2G4_PAEAL|nr:hypothetical protein [Paenibacillus alvei]MCY9763171.1 hypothetical protein [Paenibacillus alvei]
MKNKSLFEWCVLLSALLIIPGLITFYPQFYEWGTLILMLSWLGAYLVFFEKKA